MNVTKLVFLAIVAIQVGLATAASTPKQKSVAAELKALQGTWNVVETETSGQAIKPAVVTQWIFVGQKLYLRTGKKMVLQGVLSLNPSQKPRTIDVVGNGTAPVLGIYELSGQKLKVSAAPNDRPASFAGAGAAIVSVLERAKAPHLKHRGRALL